jgi:AraC family transcriptional regulator, regulatory protein of adaptative response / methylated-DNA-[protein]-cysteine methyltransferase
VASTPVSPHAPGEQIRFAVEPCALGSFLVAWSGHGIVAVLFSDSAHQAVFELASTFPRAELVGPKWERECETVRAVVEDPCCAFEGTLDVRGSSFQNRVWNGLRRIPAGCTVSYGRLAVDLGMPRAVRAVARGCASNPLAVVVPCHRVVGADGALRGYRWGVWRKHALLLREGACADTLAG